MIINSTRYKTMCQLLYLMKKEITIKNEKKKEYNLIKIETSLFLISKNLYIKIIDTSNNDIKI